MGSILLLSLVIVGAAAGPDDVAAPGLSQTKTSAVTQNDAAPPADAEAACGSPQCCSHCGCACRPKKVCRLKVGEGTYTGLEFDVKCEDYCIRGHSKCCGYRWIADKCGYRGAYRVPIWQACCGALKTRRYVVKVPQTNKVTTYTCVVEKVCCRCGFAEVDKAATADAQAKQIKPVSFEEPIVLDAGESPEPTPAALISDSAASPPLHRRLID